MLTKFNEGMTISLPDKLEFEEIKKFITLFDLDNRALDSEQFLIAKSNNKLCGFLRMRTHHDCQELSSLGIIESERGKGIGLTLLKKQIELSTKPLFLVCIIPEYFEPLGFQIVSSYPDAIMDKLNYCKNDLAVPEPYVVMQHFK